MSSMMKRENAELVDRKQVKLCAFIWMLVTMLPCVVVAIPLIPIVIVTLMWKEMK